MPTRFGSTSAVSATVSFAVFYLITVFWVRHISSRDPTSVFFDPNHAYVPFYSTIREQQAEAFVLASETHTPSPLPGFKKNSSGTKMCVGIPSVAREGASYLRVSIGSLLDGLSAEERDAIILIVLIAHTNPPIHSAYKEDWLYNLTDKVLFYDLPRDQLEHIKALEKDQGLFREKGLFDYTYLLEACYKEGSSYVALLEDDIIAMDGWFHRTIDGLEQVETRSALQKAAWDFLYLRLFYTEEFLGWNSEEWSSYLLGSLAFSIMLASILTIARTMSSILKRLLNGRVVTLIFVLYLPLLILLYFAAGKVTVQPVPTGVNEMSRYGCCSQGFVFPREKARALGEWFKTKKIGFVDVLIEEYADLYDQTRWALTPSVIQHVGRKSSKGDDFGSASKWQMSVAEKLWNFAFETHDAKDLRNEHLERIARYTNA